MTCPICARETEAKFRPFCSKRCADVDLARWVNGSYAVPSEREDEIDVDVDQEITRDLPH
jgi:endogenous inhibitor of DNA gyrase (YacG/DUF329 family)